MREDAAWRLLEEHVHEADADADDTWSELPLVRIEQRLWGLTYIDEFLGSLTDETRLGSPPDGDMTTGSVRRIYAVCDRRHDVVALLAPNGTPIEHVRYTAYGVAQVRKAADVAGSPGTVNSTDRNALLSASGARHRMDAAYDPELDLNLDGEIDTSDDALLTGAWGAYDAAEGKVSTVGATVAYAGYIYDEAVDLYLARMRWYDARDGRWMTRDPVEYGDSLSLYQYGVSRPLITIDPYGEFIQLLLPIIGILAAGYAIYEFINAADDLNKNLDSLNRNAKTREDSIDGITNSDRTNDTNNAIDSFRRRTRDTVRDVGRTVDDVSGIVPGTTRTGPAGPPSPVEDLVNDGIRRGIEEYQKRKESRDSDDPCETGDRSSPTRPSTPKNVDPPSNVFDHPVIRDTFRDIIRDFYGNN